MLRALLTMFRTILPLASPCHAVKWIVACQNIIISLCMQIEPSKDAWMSGWVYLSVHITSEVCATQSRTISQPISLNQGITHLTERAEDALHRERRQAQCARIIKYRRETCYMGIERRGEEMGANQRR